MIVKLKYQTKTFMPDATIKYVYEITPDKLKCSIRDCGFFTDKDNPIFKSIFRPHIVDVSKSDFDELYQKLVECITTADRRWKFFDDCDGKLTIYHEFGRIETMPKGYGNENLCVGNIIDEFLRNHGVN